jgi:hypothetical protein
MGSWRHWIWRPMRGNNGIEQALLFSYYFALLAEVIG